MCSKALHSRVTASEIISSKSESKPYVIFGIHICWFYVFLVVKLKLGPIVITVFPVIYEKFDVKLINNRKQFYLGLEKKRFLNAK